jgi:hypothetical protein
MPHRERTVAADKSLTIVVLLGLLGCNKIRDGLADSVIVRLGAGSLSLSPGGTSLKQCLEAVLLHSKRCQKQLIFHGHSWRGIGAGSAQHSSRRVSNASKMRVTSLLEPSELPSIPSK